MGTTNTTGSVDNDSNNAIVRQIMDVYDDVYKLNDEYGMALSVAWRHEQNPLTVHLLQEAQGHLFRIARLLHDVDQRKITPEANREKFNNVKKCIAEQITQWREACASSLGSGRPDSDLGIQAGKIALEVKFDLAFLLRSSQ